MAQKTIGTTKSTGQTYTAAEHNTDNGDINSNFAELYDLTSLMLSTGAVSFDGLTVNGSGTTFDVGNFEGYLVDHSTSPPTVEKVSITSPIVNITPTEIANGNLSYIGVGVGGSIVQKSAPFTDAESRTSVFVGTLFHSDGVNILGAFNRTTYLQGSAAQTQDLLRSLQIISAKGLKFTASGANLKIAQTAGVLSGVGFHGGDANPWESPNTINLPAQSVVPNILLVASDSSFVDAINDSIDPVNYDPNGDINNLVAVSPSNRFTIQYIEIFAGGRVNVQYGQNIYATIDAARTAIEEETYVVAPVVEDSATIRCALVVAANATDLSDPAQAHFHNFGKLGGNV